MFCIQTKYSRLINLLLLYIVINNIAETKSSGASLRYPYGFVYNLMNSMAQATVCAIDNNP